MPDLQSDTQREWDLFMECLRICFLNSYSKIQNSDLTLEQQKEIQRILRIPGALTKRAIAQFQWVNCSKPQRYDPEPGEAVKRTRRQLARTFEVLRCCKKNCWPDQTLLHKLWPRSNGFDHIEALRTQAVSLRIELQAQLSQAEAVQKKDRLRQWKSRINDPSLKGLASWVKNKEDQGAQADVVNDDTITSCPGEVTSLIHDFWTREWNQERVDVQAATNQLVADFGLTVPSDWQPIDFGMLWQGVRDSKGTHGPDNWHCDEIRLIPVPAIKVFHQCSLRWYSTGCVPAQFLQSRQVNLVKPHKVMDSRIHVKDLGPISVMSIWWRIFSAAWAKDEQTRNWTQRHLHEQVSHGKNALGCEALMDILQDRFANSQDGCITSLDWSQAFDSMRPMVTTQAMQRINFAPQFATLLQKVWTQQVRFIQYEGHTHDKVLQAGQAMPQGDPMSPLCLAIWVSAGLRSMSHADELPPNAQTFSVCYMDDRSFWTNSVECAFVLVRKWSHWSQSVGLKENTRKTQVVVKQAADRQVLLDRHPDWLVDEATILGASTTSERRKASETR